MHVIYIKKIYTYTAAGVVATPTYTHAKVFFIIIISSGFAFDIHKKIYTENIIYIYV